MKTACTHFTRSLCKIYSQGTVSCVYNFVIGYILIANCLHEYCSLMKLLSPVMELTNTRNSHRWFHENPRDTVETNVQRRFSINVCCGMIDDILIGPVMLEDRMKGQNYLDFLQNELPKQLEDVLLAPRIAMYFQHDGAPSHYTRHVMQHLNDTFSNRWIGRGSTINWPPRSPNLTPLDFKKIPIIIWDRTSDLPICNTTP